MQINVRKDLKRIIVVIFAAVMMAFNIKVLVRTGELFPGGATGLTVLIQRLALRYFSVELPYSAINLVSGFLTDLIPPYVVTYDTLLIAIFGGLINGTAISLCLSQDATSGGTDFIAIYLAEKKGVETWNLILGLNAILLLTAGYFFGWDKALYSIVYQYVSTQTMHTLYRNYQRQTLLIVTTKGQEICDEIYRLTHHGATLLNAEGAHEHKNKKFVYSVISGTDVRKAIRAIHEIDPQAFINSFRTQEIKGHFYMKPKD